MKKKQKETGKIHKPVMVREVIEYLEINAPLKSQAQKRIIDATVGTGGYSVEMVKNGAQVLGIDLDEKMLKVAKERLKEACPTPEDSFGGSFKLVHGNFKDIKKISQKEGFRNVDGVVFDLGVSSPQLTSEKRGFSFSNKRAKLDMRIDPDTQSVKAKDLLNALRQDQLIKLFEKTIERPGSRILAKRIVEKRQEASFNTVGDFLGVIKGIFKPGKTHPATRAFLALRMAVNSELENLKEALPKAFNLLGPGGQLVVVSFHSGEDAIVKTFFKKIKKDGRGKVITKKPVQPKKAEIEKNPRSRSAKLRVLKKKK